MVLSAILNPLKIPKDNVAGILITATIILNKTVAFCLEILKWLINAYIAVSKMLIPDVTAAKNNNIKNIKPINTGHGSFANISGNAIKTKDAPADGVTPNENTMGNIIIPAIIAIKVSKKINVYADFTMLLSSFM